MDYGAIIIKYNIFGTHLIYGVIHVSKFSHLETKSTTSLILKVILIFFFKSDLIYLF